MHKDCRTCSHLSAPCLGKSCTRVAQLIIRLCEFLTGIEPTGNMVKQPAKFTVDTISAGQGDVMVFVEDPEGNKEEVRLHPCSILRSSGTCTRISTSASTSAASSVFTAVG